MEAAIREGVVYRSDELAAESKEEIAGRCRKRGSDGRRCSWKRLLAVATERLEPAN
ncbi:MAG: hypothetical protein ACO1SX_17055 [Actinomycetota bacterium]